MRRALMGSRRRRYLALAVAALLLVAGLLALRGLGPWLVVEDPLRPADAIFVHNGHLPFRSMHAARLYRDGVAPEVWLVPVRPDAEARVLAELGVEAVPSIEYRRQVLRVLDVPEEAIRSLEGGVLNTAEEIEVVAREMGTRSARRVVLVTSKQHTRRVRALWRALAPDDLEAIVRYTPDDPFDPERWWTNTTDAQRTFHEVFALLNVWLGMPLGEPERDAADPAPAGGDPGR